ncbi:hypothetical protein ABZU76_46325 [Amycolatopsis sp. NPDC005232]|uniref:hypothetical protein n=1 Tax=Amycolatopsis sp. NPDC005232 TaxID=3157027 RepID=UPI0033A2FC1A
MRDADSIEDRLTRLIAAWRRDVDTEPTAASLGIDVMRRDWLARRTSRCAG